MANTWGDIELKPRVDGGFLTNPDYPDDGPPTLKLKAWVSSEDDYEALKSAKGKATFSRGLGLSGWNAVLEHGTYAPLSIVTSGSGDGHESSTFPYAILTRISSRGDAWRRGRYDVDLTFALPENVGL